MYVFTYLIVCWLSDTCVGMIQVRLLRIYMMSVPNGERSESGLQQHCIHAFFGNLLENRTAFIASVISFIIHDHYLHKEAMFYPAYVLHLYVCMYVGKTTDHILMKILPKMYLCKRKKPLNFGSRPPPDIDLGIFRSILLRCKIGHFSTV